MDSIRSTFSYYLNEIRNSNQLDKEDDDQPKLYLQIKLNYFQNLRFINRSKRNEIQRLYNWLFNSFNLQQTPSILIKTKKLKDDTKLINLTKRFQNLKNFSKLNFDKELTNYIYGNPSKLNLDQMQIQLRTYTDDKYLLLKVNESCKLTSSCNRVKKIDANEMRISNNGKLIKKNELVVSLDLLLMIFKNFKNETILNDNLNDNFILELTGYRFKIILIIIYALYTNQLYLNLDIFPEIVQVSLDLGIEQILKFINKLILKEDPIYILFKLRKYLTDLLIVTTDLISLTKLSKQMTYVLREIVTSYDKLISYPGILDLTYYEINFLIWKKRTIFKAFKLSVIRNELNVIKAILDWYLIDKESREDQCLNLLKKIDYDSLTDEQLDKLVNCFLLNYYSDDVKLFLKSEFNCELKRRKQFGSYFQDLAYSKSVDDASLNLKFDKRQKKTTALDESMIKNAIKQENDDENKDSELKETLDHYLKSLIHLGLDLGSFSLIVSSSPIYKINERSIMLLLGGFKSHLPYSKDQGKLMYHLIKTNDNSIKIHLPSILTHDWFPLQERLPKNLAHFATIRILNLIFIIGGLDLNFLLSNKRKKVKPISNCYVLNLATSNWFKIKNMNMNRAFHCAVRHESLIYVFGGLTCAANNLNVCNSMEFYDIDKNSWFTVYDQNQNTLLPSPRMAFGMELIDKNTICIIGGISSIQDRNLNFSSTSLLDDCWFFNLNNKTFSHLTNLRLPNSRASFGLIKHQNELLLIGGIELQTSTADQFLNHHASKNILITTSNVLACKLETRVKKINDNNQDTANLSNQTSQFRLETQFTTSWYLHSKLNQQRIFPLVSKCLNTILVAGGKTQDHFYLKKISLTNYCSTYEVLNSDTLKWVESPVMFATFGSCLISL